MKLLVTGASGFLGRRVVACALQAGHTVRAVVRPATSVDHLNWPEDVEVFRADLRGGVDLTPAFNDVDAVIHLAAGMDGTDEQRFQATVAGTERLLDAMEHSDTRRLILASSFYVYDWSRVRRRLTEDCVLAQSPEKRDGYTVAKLWQERVSRRAAERNGWDLIVMRPGFIWGQGSELPARVGMPVGRSLAVVGPLTDTALTHVDNCAEYFVRAAERRELTDETFNIFDGHRVSSWRFAKQYLQRTGTQARRLPIPYIAGYATTCLAKGVSRMLFGRQGKLPSLLVPALYQSRFRPLRFSTDKLFAVLDPPRRSFEECLTATFSAPTNDGHNVSSSQANFAGEAKFDKVETAPAPYGEFRQTLAVSAHETPLTRTATK